MDISSPSTIKEILSTHQAKPSKSLGQNFLIDKNILKKIIETADIKPYDVILEVGPGIGMLTQKLAEKAKRIIAIEKDRVMIEILKETLKDFKNITVIQGDILKTEIKLPKKYKVVANIPYYLTSPLIRKFLESSQQPQEMILMIQKEVAQRICSAPPDMSLLAVSVQFYAKAEIMFYVSKNSFWPAPKIDSAIIKITPHSPLSFSRKRESREFCELFFKVVKAGFSQPRKQLAGNLSKILKLERKKVEAWLLQNNIKPTQRAETLSIKDWENLANTFIC